MPTPDSTDSIEMHFTHPLTGALTTTCLHVESVDPNPDIHPHDGSGRNWKRYKLLAVASNLVRHSAAPSLLGHYITQLVTTAPTMTADTLEIPEFRPSPNFVQEVTIPAGEYICVGKHIDHDGDQLFVEEPSHLVLTRSYVNPLLKFAQVNLAAMHSVCARYAVPFTEPTPAQKAGVPADIRETVWPLNGLRHPPQNDTSGWYFWRGRELSQAPDYFQPVHALHLPDMIPEVLPYLGLPPGWRFLIAPDYQDVWYDPSLLDV